MYENTLSPAFNTVKMAWVAGLGGTERVGLSPFTTADAAVTASRTGFMIEANLLRSSLIEYYI